MGSRHKDGCRYGKCSILKFSAAPDQSALSCASLCANHGRIANQKPEDVRPGALRALGALPPKALAKKSAPMAKAPGAA